ncbi:MAG: VCBS repeat-containing protein [Saprospiraceae bacterium]|nr:VCBS repeat-containing protein [Saprospiraceae bacterium]
MTFRNINFVYFCFFMAAHLLVFLSGCKNTDSIEKDTDDQESSKPIFTLLDAKAAGIYYYNELAENEDVNIFSYEYLYNGSGVAVGDVNNDGLLDIFFGGNLFGGRLFLNKGNLKFEQISEKAGVFVNGYTTGVSMADVNNDGWMDIYLCRSLSTDPNLRKNVLLINNKNNTFTDMAKEYGLDDPGYSQQAYFVDYDNDSDPDMFLLNHRSDFSKSLTLGYKPETNQENLNYSCVKLFQNNGKGKFSDVTKKSGLFSCTFGLSAAISDFNNDGWKDIYICSDFADKDRLFMNQNGKFHDVADEHLFHISRNSMGSDAADINHDGFMDFISLDMMAETNYRQKQLKGQSPYDMFHLAKSYGLNYQVMRNTLQLNNGNGTFSEIGQLAGVSHTDWSWAPLFADYDNDGWVDLFISNGYYRDVTDMDFVKFSKKDLSSGQKRMDLLNQIKHSPISNYVYKNNKNLTFSNKTVQWGLDQKAISNGAAYADLDNDGDLELIVNNFNEPALIYKNNARENNNHHFLKVQPIDAAGHTIAAQIKVWVFYNNSFQVQELQTNRGYLSSVPPVLHFGLGNTEKIDSMIISWSDGKMEVIKGISVDKEIQLLKKNAKSNFKDPLTHNRKSKLFNAANLDIKPNHTENPYIDFKSEPLLEEKYSNTGPCISVGDVNDDGYDDIYIGGSHGYSGQLLIQKNKTFINTKVTDFELDKLHEDSASAFNDVDGDGDLDLYVSSGSNESNESSLLNDRIYLNDGKGNFLKNTSILPADKINSSCINFIDFDKDGDSDLFLGGGVKSGNFPDSHPSKLYENSNGKFIDVSHKLPNEGKIGILLSAIWVDINNDGKSELITAGHWTDIRVFVWNGQNLVEQNNKSLSQKKGLWNIVVSEDFDKDGDKDLVVGNRGLNSFYKASQTLPAKLLIDDFDDNGKMDAIPNYHFSDQILNPKHTLDELAQQMPVVRKWFPQYEKFSKTRSIDIFDNRKFPKMKTMEVNNYATTYFKNMGNGTFEISALPNEAQISKVNDIMVKDLNKDGFADLILVGNQYGSDVEMGRSDASVGLVLFNDKKGNFKPVHPAESGLCNKGDARRIVSLKKLNKDLVMIFNNDGISTSWEL